MVNPGPRRYAPTHGEKWARLAYLAGRFRAG